MPVIIIIHHHHHHHHYHHHHRHLPSLLVQPGPGHLLQARSQLCSHTDQLLVFCSETLKLGGKLSAKIHWSKLKMGLKIIISFVCQECSHLVWQQKSFILPACKTWDWCWFENEPMLNVFIFWCMMQRWCEVVKMLLAECSTRSRTGWATAVS